jgi:glycosyltransferase involved in cell wall biosynthesis
MKRLGVVNTETWDFLKDLYPYLASRYETHVFTPRVSGSPLFRERIDRYTLRRDLSRFLKEHDVVFFEWASALLALATQLKTRCRIVTRLHRYEMYTWADRINWDAVGHVILVSEAKRREFVGKFPAQAAKTHVVPAGISCERFRYVPRPFSGSIGTLCHLTPRKRVYDLVLALSGLLRANTGLRLLIAGDPDPAYMDYYAALRRLVSRLDLASKVTFEGPVERPWEWYPKIDVFVSHSFSEGLQVAAMEAMASGCYTLSHDWEGAEELVPGQCLYVTDDDLARKIEAFCRVPREEQESLRRQMRALASERFDSQRINQRVADIVERASAGRSEPAYRGEVSAQNSRVVVHSEHT